VEDKQGGGSILPSPYISPSNDQGDSV
jgi:hypothetical protein